MAAYKHRPEVGLNNRLCPECGTLLVRRAQDYASTFRRRIYCSNHCARVNATKRDVRTRFEEKVDRQPGHGPNGECHVWKAALTKDGYGTFDMNGATWLAHRASFALSKGCIPDGLLVCHSCDNPGCVNISHLFLGTHDDNMKDMAKKGRAKPQFGERHTSAKLTEKEVRLVLADNRSNDKVASDFGVSKVAIRQIRSGKTWKHVERPELLGRPIYNRVVV